MSGRVNEVAGSIPGHVTPKTHESGINQSTPLSDVWQLRGCTGPILTNILSVNL